MEFSKYIQETEVVMFQGREVLLHNLSPIFMPEQKASKHRELERQLYDVFYKYTNNENVDDAC